MKPFSLNIKGDLYEFRHPLVMGIINVTPDSFWAGSRTDSPLTAVDRAVETWNLGADIIDIGACSTRPGSKPVSPAEELARLIPTIEGLRQRVPESMLISVDTFRAEVAAAALDAGANIINDVSGLADPEMLPLLTSRKVPYILTHSADVTDEPFESVTSMVIRQLQEKTRQLALAGVSDVIVDPGFGFGKTLEQNYRLMHDLALFEVLERPILVGVSRKSMITRVLGTDPAYALDGTTVLNTAALLAGVSIIRVHDPLPARQTVKIIEAINQI